MKQITLRNVLRSKWKISEFFLVIFDLHAGGGGVCWILRKFGNAIVLKRVIALYGMYIIDQFLHVSLQF